MSVARLAHVHASASNPTSHTHSCREQNQDSPGAAPPAVATAVTPCQQAPNRWLRPFRYDQLLAASGCADCPVATGCLLTGLRLNAAHRNGEDPYGVYGVYGGVWFEPGQPPSRIPVLSEEQARAGHAAHARLRAAGEAIPDDVGAAERFYACVATGRRRRSQAA
jgi:hypothetical protein